VALHEAGHAVVGWFLQYAEPLLKVHLLPPFSSANILQLYAACSDCVLVQQASPSLCLLTVTWEPSSEEASEQLPCTLCQRL